MKLGWPSLSLIFLLFKIPPGPADTKRHFRSRIQVDRKPYCKCISKISVDLPASCKGGSVVQANPGFRSLGSDLAIHFWDQRTYLVTIHIDVRRDLLQYNVDPSTYPPRPRSNSALTADHVADRPLLLRLSVAAIGEALSRDDLHRDVT